MNTQTFRMVALAVVFVAVGACPTPLSAQDVPLTFFEGTWVGLETWTPDNPSAQEPQIVTMTFEVEDGALSGTIVPFLGLRAGASITEAEVVGGELHAKASAGRLGWQREVGIALTLNVDADAMTGNADLTLGDVKWVKLDYELSRKRSRYGNGN